MNYSIVVPTCRSNDKCEGLLTNLLDSIKWGDYPAVANIVLAWEPDCSREFISSFEIKYPFIISLMPEYGKPNLNFTKNANRGLRYVHKELADSGSGVIICNMDCLLPTRSYLEKIFNSGLASPRAEHFDGSAWNKYTLLNQKNSPGCPCNKTIYNALPEDSKKFACFCTWISKEVMDKIGYFDSTTFSSSFEDDDYVIRALLGGFHVQQFPIVVHHELKNRDPSKGEQISTTGSYSLNDLGVSGWKFIQKWKLPFGLDRHAEFADYIVNNWKGDPPLYCK